MYVKSLSLIRFAVATAAHTPEDAPEQAAPKGSNTTIDVGGTPKTRGHPHEWGPGARAAAARPRRAPAPGRPAPPPTDRHCAPRPPAAPRRAPASAPATPVRRSSPAAAAP